MLTFTFTEGGPTKPFEAFIEAEMDKSLKHFEKELTKIRTGRAHTSMVEDIKVACYGSYMPLKEVAGISAPEAGLLIVQPWDTTIITEIEKAISSSDLGVNPATDGAIIRIPLPRMSTARREELSKVLFQRLEECKIGIRNARKDVHTLIRDTEKAKKVSEDYSKRLQDILQKITDKFTDLGDKLAQKKHTEIKEL